MYFLAARHFGFVSIITLILPITRTQIPPFVGVKSLASQNNARLQFDGKSLPSDIATDDSTATWDETAAYLKKKAVPVLNGAMNERPSLDLENGYDFPFDGKDAKSNLIGLWPTVVPFRGFTCFDLLVTKKTLQIKLRKKFECTSRELNSPDFPYLPMQNFAGTVNITLNFPLDKVRKISFTPGEILISTVDADLFAKQRDTLLVYKLISDSVTFYTDQPGVVTDNSIYHIKLGDAAITTRNANYHLYLGGCDSDYTERISKALRHLVRLAHESPDLKEPGEPF